MAPMAFIAAALVTVMAPAPAESALRLPSLLGDHAMLQRGMAAPVWGWASPGARVTVRVAGQSAAANAGADGVWRLRLKPLAAGGPHEMRVTSGAETLTVRDIMVGEVWVASGQSNMVWPVSQSRDGAAETRAADYPAIRLFAVPRTAAPGPRLDCVGSWAPCTPTSVANFSGVAYYFGRELHRRLREALERVRGSATKKPCVCARDVSYARGGVVAAPAAALAPHRARPPRARCS